jgi:hypothetical protein
MYSSTLSLTSALDGGRWSTPHPGRCTPGKEIRYPLYRRLGGPQGWSGWVRKISLPPTLDSHTVQPLASSYTDWAISAPILRWVQQSKGMKNRATLNGMTRVNQRYYTNYLKVTLPLLIPGWYLHLAHLTSALQCLQPIFPEVLSGAFWYAIKDTANPGTRD